MESLAVILAADVIAIATLVGAGAKFIASQSARIASTEHRLTALETSVAEVKSDLKAYNDASTQMLERMAILETKVDRLLAVIEKDA